jgi:putative addiction module component (TIGR02574 family)
MSAALQELLRRPVEEKLEAINALWDSIDAERGGPRLSDTDMAELHRRLDEYELDPTGNLTLQEVISGLRPPK